MTENVTVQIAVPVFSATQEGSPAANQVFYLENYVPPGYTLPNPTYITETIIWEQSASVYGPGVQGDIAIAVDPARLYMKASGFPAVQNSAPAYLKTLCQWEMMPGGSHKSVKQGRVGYRPGDAIIFAPELTGGPQLQVFVNITFEAEADIVARPRPDAILDVLSITLDTNSGENNNTSIRNIVPPLAIGGRQLRIRVASRASGCVVQHASVGVRDGQTANMMAAPVELTFGGNHGFTLPPNTDLWSDWVNLTTAPGQSLLVHVSMFSGPGNNAWALKSRSADDNYSSATDSWNTAVMGGPILQRMRTHVVTQVQVVP